MNIGLVPDGGSSAFIPARVGLTRAIEMAMLGERVHGPQALDWGLVNAVHPDDELQAAADALVARLAAGPTLLLRRRQAPAQRVGLRGARRSSSSWRPRSSRSRRVTQDFVEGVTAFLQKRPAAFEGR